ncbi:cytochrome c-type biogenesis protein CycH [Octadecabacter antarcticus 307]|uniref:Cytochrome c-type biogenesis protein CycH n=1 Tax=Octadecabacter antarcticus 307 TaxID=391626 RepID=M9R810_9RHOB|nr:c-type cytochrome biogenesis protein CcmI [Octadecabacter antarcticus]AGI68814.1 cytochrome c-type biogenesis protein CycH [Octadecabacter antarcticus 307]
MTFGIIIFWLICASVTALAIAAVLVPLRRDHVADATPDFGADTDIDIYRYQLDEVDRDLARGVLEVTEAERTRIEISRRLLHADANTRTATTDAPQIANRVVVRVLAAVIVLGAGGIYLQLGAPGYGDVPRAQRIADGEERRENRPSQQDAESANRETDAISQADVGTREILQALRGTAFERPYEVRAWAFLAQTEASIGNMQRAARAQERTIALLGGATVNPDYVRLLDFLVIGAQGYVSPEVEAITISLLQSDPDNTAGQYYAGLLYAQNDRPDRAFSFWRSVVEDGEQGTLYWNSAASQIADVAAQLGIDYALPNQRGPTADDLAVAQYMPEQDRNAMIQGMVGQLADRLATTGGPPQDWARLISSLAVLGENETALIVLAEAEATFGGDVQAVQILRRAAQEAGLME